MRPTRLLAALAAAALVAGCGGEGPKPSTLPSKSASPSTSASPTSTATPPVLPVAAKANSRGGATEFVRHYVNVLNFVTFNGQVALARALDAGKCSSCDNMLGAIDSIYKQGGRVEGGAWSPTVVSDVRHPDNKGWTVDTKITYGPQTVVRKAGSKVERYSGGGRVVSFTLEYADGAWRVSEWTRAS